MYKAIQKITLSPSQKIPFEKLMLSQSNVRRIKASVSIEELAADIARRGLLQSLSVRPVLDEATIETDMFEIPAGGRRFQALSLLVKQKRLAKSTPIPCIIRDAGSDILAEDDSLAEDMQRVALHPLDQFRAFVALRKKGQCDEEIAAAFFLTPQIVRQRLKPASTAPALRNESEKHQGSLSLAFRNLINFGGRFLKGVSSGKVGRQSSPRVAVRFCSCARIEDGLRFGSCLRHVSTISCGETRSPCRLFSIAA